MKTKQVILGSRDSYGRYEVKTKKQKKTPQPMQKLSTFSQRKITVTL